MTFARYAIAGLFLTTGTLHFLKPEIFQRIVPPALPWPRGIVYLTGLLELAGGAGLLLPRFQKAAGYGLALFLVAVLPANIYMAMTPVKFGGFFDHPLYHWIRIPFQGVLIAWLIWCTR